ncbi:MAG: T9SS type A sorting domain-containing protein [Bacteroidales bacterium]|nr:T9SS type A sorting domain-containing protein [Bacteroidales bacterium]
MKRWSILFILFFSYRIVSGQISQGGTPYALQSSMSSESPAHEKCLDKQIRTIITPQVDKHIVDSILLHNKLYEECQFAYGFDANINVTDYGTKDSIQIGTLYRLLLISPGAKSINLIFSKYKVPPGAKLFIYSADGRHIIGAFTSNNNKSCEILPTIPVYGDSIVVEYFEPYFPEFYGQLVIGTINHDFIGIVSESGLFDDDSGTCHVDVNCSPEGDNWQTEKKAVCEIIINGRIQCSGVLLNNTNMDGTPYFLTANHCIDSQDEANHSIFIFNYEKNSCGGSSGNTNQSISSSILRATNTDSDFSLLEFSHKPLSSWNPYYAGWDRQDIQGPGGVCIHHPAGDVKKISTYTMSPTSSNCIVGKPQNNFYLISQWISTLNGHGVTEGGSSGSPLFNNNHNVIGQLYGGCPNHNDNCDNPSNDYSNYGKIYSSWDYNGTASIQLKNWLDPNNCGCTSMNGASVCPQEVVENLNLSHTVNAGVVEIHQARKNIISNCNIKYGSSVHYIAGESVLLTPGTHIEHGSDFLAEIQSYNCVPGCHPISFQIINTSFQNGGDLCFYQTNAQSYYLRLVNMYGQTVFQSSGNTNGYQNCVQMPINLAAGIFVATIILYNECNEYSESFSVTNISSKSIMAEIDQEDKIKCDFDFQVCPNPSDGSFIIDINKNQDDVFTLDIYTSIGTTVLHIEYLSESHIEINNNALPSGVYFIRLMNRYCLSTKKIIVH